MRPIFERAAAQRGFLFPAQSLAVLRNAGGQPARRRKPKGPADLHSFGLLVHAHARARLHDARFLARARRLLFPPRGIRLQGFAG